MRITTKIMNKVLQARKYAEQFHRGHKRLSDDSLFDHVAKVHNRIEKCGISNENLQVASYLYYVYKKDPSKKAYIKENFGDRVFEIIDKYSKLAETHVKQPSQQFKTQSYLVQTFINVADDLDALVLRLADRIVNLQTSYIFDKEERNRIARRALTVYAPISNLLGITYFVRSFENEAFKILNPSEFSRIDNVIDNIHDDVNEFFKDTKSFLKEFLSEKGIKAHVNYRLKHHYSIYKKHQKFKKIKAKIYPDFQHLYDIVALRIITDSVEDCYTIEDILKSLWDQYDFERDDYIQNPKSSGYQSLQCAYAVSEKFNAEVQIRTHQMHEVNEYGFSSHVIYKIGSAGGDFGKYLQNDKNWLKKLNYWEKDQVLDESEVAQKYFHDKVYVFTPKGDIIELSRGATALDFAYAVHVKVGHQCIGAMVNGKIAKLDQVLHDGDTVLIKTDKKKKLPSRNWLDIVKTRKASLAIKKALRGKL